MKTNKIYIVAEWERNEDQLTIWNVSYSTEKEALESIEDHCEGLDWEIDCIDEVNNEIHANDSIFTVGPVWLD